MIVLFRLYNSVATVATITVATHVCDIIFKFSWAWIIW